MAGQLSGASNGKPNGAPGNPHAALREQRRRYQQALWLFVGASVLNAVAMLITFITRNPYANLGWMLLLLVLVAAYEGHRRAKKELKEAEQKLARSRARPH